MRRAWLFLAFSLTGCAQPNQELVRDYNQDGVYLFERGDYAHAQESFEAALALKQDDAALLYNLGECCERQGNTARAETIYNQCLQRAPNHAECRHALDALLVRSNRREEAVRMVDAWLASQPKLAAPYAEDGWLWLQAGDLPHAQARLQQALELDPHETRALIELARVYEALQRSDRAIALYERVLERNPRQTEVQKRLSELRAQGVGRPRPD